MKRLIASLFLVAAMAGNAFADVFVFETVDEYERVDESLRFRGVLQGEAEPSELDALFFTDPAPLTTSCERQALMAMARPGRYLFQVTTQPISSGELLVSCRLIRR